jgi:hypothetical protein
MINLLIIGSIKLSMNFSVYLNLDFLKNLNSKWYFDRIRLFKSHKKFHFIWGFFNCDIIFKYGFDFYLNHFRLFLDLLINLNFYLKIFIVVFLYFYFNPIFLDFSRVSLLNLKDLIIIITSYLLCSNDLFNLFVINSYNLDYYLNWYFLSF